jgi:hypothetical protein
VRLIDEWPLATTIFEEKLRHEVVLIPTYRDWKIEKRLNHTWTPIFRSGFSLEVHYVNVTMSI